MDCEHLNRFISIDKMWDLKSSYSKTLFAGSLFSSIKNGRKTESDLSKGVSCQRTLCHKTIYKNIGLETNS